MQKSICCCVEDMYEIMHKCMNWERESIKKDGSSWWMNWEKRDKERGSGHKNKMERSQDWADEWMGRIVYR